MTLIFLFYLLLYISETKGKCSFAKFMRSTSEWSRACHLSMLWGQSPHSDSRVRHECRSYFSMSSAISLLVTKSFFFLLPHLQFCQKNFFPVFSFFPSFDAKVKCANIGTRDAIERQIIVDKSLNLIGNSKIFYLSKKSNQM